MNYPVRFLLASMFVLAFTACGGGDAPKTCPESQVCGEACCSVDETCIDSVCQPQARCEAGQTSCGSACCDDATEICVDGSCEPPCTPCGETCCGGETPVCLDGACACDETSCGERKACNTYRDCVQCPLESQLDDFVALDGRSDWNPYLGGNGYAVMRADHPSGEATVRLMLWQGYGAFVDGIRLGTFELEGDRLDFGKCEVCVFLTVYDSNKEAAAEYMTTGGQIEITDYSLETGLKATLRNVTFKHANIIWDGHKMEPAASNCTTSIANGTYGGPFPPQCDPMSPVACDTGAGCQFWPGLGFVCRVSEGLVLDETCDYSYECSPGLDCFGANRLFSGSCVELCREKSTCSFLATCEHLFQEHDVAGLCVACPATQTCGSICCEEYQSCQSSECVDRSCPVDALLGEFQSTGWTNPDLPSVLQVPIPSADSSADLLTIEVRGVQLGTYSLEGTQLDYNTCTICVLLAAFDVSGTAAGFYFATGGTVEITSVDGGISAILHDVSFGQVLFHGDGSMHPHPQGCAASLTSATVSSNGSCAPWPAQPCGPSCCPASEYCDVFAETPACIAVTAPSNDACGLEGASAIALTLDAPPVSGQTIGAAGDYRIQPGSCAFPWAADASGSEVVYSYTPDADGTFYATVRPAFEFDPLLWYTAGTCGDGGLCTAAIDDNAGGYSESMVIEGSAGVTYYIYVDFYTGAFPGGGVFSIAVTAAAP